MEDVHDHPPQPLSSWESEDITQQQELLAIHRKNLYRYLRQLAMQGFIFAPVNLLNNIDYERAKIRDIKDNLRKRKIHFENYYIDDETREEKTSQHRKSKVRLFVRMSLVALAAVTIRFEGYNSLREDGKSIAIAADSANTADVAFLLDITSPANGSEVDPQIAIQGRINYKMCGECNIYVVIHPDNPGEEKVWHIQAAESQTATTFSLSNVNIGRNSSEDNGKAFEIWAVVGKDLRTGAMREAPPEADVSEKIRVIRKP